MGYGTIFLEGLLGLFLLLTGCLFLRTMMLEAPQTFSVLQRRPRNAHQLKEADMSDSIELFVADMKKLEANGVTPKEIAALLHLKKWYQVGEGDRAVLLSRWEFIKQLIHDGRIEV